MHNFLRLSVIVLALIGWSVHSFGQPSKKKIFYEDVELAEMNKLAIAAEKDFFFFIWEDQDDALTTYYRDTIFKNNVVTNELKDRFICVSASKDSKFGTVFTKQFYPTNFPAMMFVGWKKGDEMYSLQGRLEVDQVLDQLERIGYR
jgi:hypothetical protein